MAINDDLPVGLKPGFYRPLADRLRTEKCAVLHHILPEQQDRTGNASVTVAALVRELPAEFRRAACVKDLRAIGLGGKHFITRRGQTFQVYCRRGGVGVCGADHRAVAGTGLQGTTSLRPGVESAVQNERTGDAAELRKPGAARGAHAHLLLKKYRRDVVTDSQLLPGAMKRVRHALNPGSGAVRNEIIINVEM